MLKNVTRRTVATAASSLHPTAEQSCPGKVTMRVLSGENETELTQLVCPRKGSPTGCPVAASHSRTVQSFEPVTMRVPSGEKETEVTAEVCLSTVRTTGQFISRPIATRRVFGNRTENCLDSGELAGENGSADIYRCGVLYKMIPPKT
jgi:hypothetical protein